VPRRWSPLRQGIAGAAEVGGFGSDLDFDSLWINTVARSLDSAHDPADERYIFRSASCSQVIWDSRRGGFAIAADAEIHNRADLLPRLSAGQLSSSCSDARLILAAYEKWGQNCPGFLVGEFSFVIWDARRRRLFCCRDHMGRRPFFYWTNGSRLAFSSDPLWLFSLPGVGRELNRAKLAAWASPSGFASDSHGEETFHQGIFSLPSATSITFEDGQLRKRNYWTPDGVSVHVPPSEEDAFETLRELLFEAVDCRLRGKTRVAAFLSGGLDSSAIVSVAARCLEKSNRGVVAFAAVLPEESKPQFRDEREFINEFRGWPNVNIQHVAPAGGGPFDGIEDTSCFEANPLRYSRQYLLDAMYDAAIRVGSDVVLTGMGGEAGVTTWGRGYYLELASRLRWHGLARELLQARAVRRISPVRALWREVRESLSPGQPFERLVLLAPDFLREMEGVPEKKFHWPDHRTEQLWQIRASMNTHAFRRGTSGTHVPTTLPFLDKRVLEFCLAAPGSLKVRDGYRRYLVRGALNGILPKRIQWRTTKCAFSPDYFKRYHAQIGKARDFVAAIRRNDPVCSIVDVHRLRHLLHQPNIPAGRITALVAVPTTIYLICFLRQFADFQP
jgi:asparagine synthase (glutamine-hydrolysing)